MHTADAIVIGAGHNGLVAANLLADEGWDVVVLEEQPDPGGALRTEEITAPGFRSDLCAAFFPLGAASPVLRGLDLTEHGLRWLHAPDALAHVFPDDRCAVLSRDLDRTAESVAQFAPEDAHSWRELFSQWQGFRDEFLDALFTPFPPLRAGARFLRRTGTAELLRLARMLTLPARRFARERFEGEGARLLLSGNAAHSDLSVDNAGSAVFGWLLGMLAQDIGFPVPEGGAGELAAALARRLRSKGGSVHCRTPVTEVLVARGKAVGVRCADGEPIRARKAVLADVTAETLYGNLVAPEWLPSRLLADLRVFEWDSATVKLDWALSEPIPWTARDARGAGTVHLGCDEDGLSAFGAELARDRVPEQPFLLLGQMTTADSTRSPMRHRIRVGLHARPARQRPGHGAAAGRTHRGDGGAQRTRVPGVDPGPPRAGPGGAGRPRREPGRRRGQRRHHGDPPAAVLPPGAGPRPRGHPGGPAVPHAARRPIPAARSTAGRARTPPVPRWPASTCSARATPR